MADEIQFSTGGATADDPAIARSEIERTRSRMSETIDDIEDALLRRKERIQNRLDVLAPVRERPFAALGAVLGAGLLLGLITGGDDDDDDRFEEAEERAELWERRARRLLRIARQQEAELEALGGSARLTSRAGAARMPHLDGELEDDDEMGGVRDQLAGRLGGFLADTVGQLFGAGARTA